MTRSSYFGHALGDSNNEASLDTKIRRRVGKGRRGLERAVREGKRRWKRKERKRREKISGENGEGKTV